MQRRQLGERARLALLCGAAAGLSGCAQATPASSWDSGVAGPACAQPLGLYADSSCETLRAGVMSFTPQYTLWSDGVSKERHVFIPPGETIDVSDPDAWVFPVGTRLWKHFETAEGTRLETRAIEKIADLKGATGWAFETYAWNSAGDGVTRITEGSRDVLGTDHDIPSEDDCAECHSGGENQWEASLAQDQLLDLPLGFGAIQLNHDDSDVTLESLSAGGWLSGSVSLSGARIPGDETTRAALGYLHANCGSCHGGERPAKDLTMLVPVGTASVQDTPAYQGNVNHPTDPNSRATGIDDMPSTRIVPGDPDSSALIWRMRQRSSDDAPMPPLATDIVDEEGVSTVADWIQSL